VVTVRGRQTLLLARFLLAAAFIVFVFLVANSPARIIYDERYFVQDVPLLHAYGFTPKFLNALTGAVGPLYALLHAAFEPWTHLDPVDMRFVHVLLLVVLFSILLASFKRAGAVDPWVAAGSVMIVPMTWVLAGIALSEMPAIVFVSLSLYCQLRGLESVETRRTCLLWFAASALCLGIAVWGRQPYFVLGGVPVLLALRDRRLLPMAAVFVCVVSMVALPLFFIWHGLTPPSHRFFQPALLPDNGVVSLGYIGVCLLLLEPALIWSYRKILAGLFAVILLLNVMFSLSIVRPLRTLVAALSGTSLWLYEHLCGAIILTLGVGTFLFICRSTWQDRFDQRRLAVGIGLLCVAIWPAFMGSEYSSRYTAMALPYLLLMAEPWRRWNLGTIAAAAVGCALGAASLQSYYS
jgi:hypothetical protein